MLTNQTVINDAVGFDVRLVANATVSNDIACINPHAFAQMDVAYKHCININKNILIAGQCATNIDSTWVGELYASQL